MWGCSTFSRLYIKIHIKLLMNLAAFHVGAALPRLVRGNAKTPNLLSTVFCVAFNMNYDFAAVQLLSSEINLNLWRGVILCGVDRVCACVFVCVCVCVCVCMAEQFAVSHMESGMILARQPKPWTRMEARNIPYYMTCDSIRWWRSCEDRTERKLGIGNEIVEMIVNNAGKGRINGEIDVWVEE